MYFKFLHLNYSYSIISFSLFLHRYTHHQSTASIVHSNTTQLPYNLATAMTLPPHPPTLVLSLCHSCNSHRQIFLLPLRPHLLHHLSLRAKIVFEVFATFSSIYHGFRNNLPGCSCFETIILSIVVFATVDFLIFFCQLNGKK